MYNEGNKRKGVAAMLNFITGTKGSGKTTYTHKLIGEYVKNEKADAILIVPRQFTFESDRGILDALGAKDACNVEVLSFSRLADIIFKTCGGPKKPILGDGADAAIMALALDSVKDRLHLFSKHYSDIGFVKKMISQISIFKQNAVTDDELDEFCNTMSDGYLKSKLSETALIYRAYNTLTAQSFFDDKDVLDLVWERLLDSDYFDNKIVAIDDFSDFSNQELKIIERMMICAKEVFITLCSDNIDSSDELSPFACVNRTTRRLKNIAEKNSIGIGKVTRLTDKENGFTVRKYPELAHLESNLYNPVFVPYEEEAKAVTLCVAPSVREECDLAAQQIRMLMRSENYRCRDIAVVYRNPDIYAKEIKYSLKKFGVPVFEDMRAPVENEPLIILARSLIMMCAGSFTTENIMRYLKTGLTVIPWDEIAEVENYALMWDIGSSKWQSEWKDNPDGFGVELNEERAERLSKINETREKIIAPLARFRDELKISNAKESMKLLYEFLIENKINQTLKEYAITLENEGRIELAVEQEQVWDILMNVLDDVAGALGSNTVSPSLLLEIFDLVVSTQSLGKLPDGYDEVYICDAARISTQMPKVVFVLGMNSGEFPKTPSEIGVFTQNENVILSSALEKMRDFTKERASDERFMVYNALCSAREKLYVSWALASSSGEKLQESEAVVMLNRILPDCCEKNYSLLSEEELVEGEVPAFELMARDWRKNSEKEQALKQYFSLLPEYRDRIAAIERSVNKKSFRFENDDTAKKLFGKKMSLSASQLENYEECPFKYFCRYGIRAKPRQTAKLDPANSGTVVHYVLEKLMSGHSGKAFASLEKSIVQKEIKSILKEYIDLYMGGTEGKSKRFIYLYNRMFKTLLTIVERLLSEFQNSSFEPFGFEVRIGKGRQIEPYTIELNDGYIELCGIVDRVDKMDLEDKRYIRVVDYKTGKKEFSLSDVLGGLGMQMLLYLVSIWRSNKNEYENIIPAGVLYLPARFEPYDSDRNDDSETVCRRRLAGGKMDGMILDDGDVVKGMDNSLEGMFIPISQNKRSGAIKGTFYSLEQLGRLANRMDKIMAEMGNSLHEGKVPAKPVVGKGHANTCEWCDFSSICMRERDGEFRYLEKRNHSECLNSLDSEEGAG